MLLYSVRVRDGLPDVASAGGHLTADIIQTNHQYCISDTAWCVGRVRAVGFGRR
jgi:hypothetical protein